MKALIAILLTVLPLVACGSIPSANNNENVFRINIGSNPLTLHPGLATDHSSITLLKATMEGLTRIGQDGEPQLAAAKQFDLSEDRLTYTFSLRDLTWNNGEPVTAFDFEYAWKWALAPENRSEYAYRLYPIRNAEKANKGELPIDQVGIEATDDQTLVVTLQNPTPYFLDLTANAPYLPIPCHIAESEPNWHKHAESVMSNGPFQLSKWESGEQIVLEKNEQYWDASRVQLDRLEMLMLDDVYSEIDLFKKGALDWTGAPFSTLPNKAISQFSEDGRIEMSPIAGTYEFRFNTNRPPFDHPKIRKALAYAIDRQAIVDNVMPGRLLPAMAFIPPTIFPENKEGLFLDYDLEQAQQYLAAGMREMGLSELPPIELAYQPNEAHEKLAMAVQEMWEESLGIKVILKDVEWEDQWAQAQTGNFQLARMSWIADFNDAVDFLEIFTIPEGNNVTNWTSDEYNQFIAASYKEIDPEHRKELLKKAEKILIDEMPSIPIYFYTYSYAKSDRFSGAYIDPLGIVDFKYVTIQP